jgi:hypothetical protein
LTLTMDPLGLSSTVDIAEKCPLHSREDEPHGATFHVSRRLK